MNTAGRAISTTLVVAAVLLAVAACRTPRDSAEEIPHDPEVPPTVVDLPDDLLVVTDPPFSLRVDPGSIDPGFIEAILVSVDPAPPGETEPRGVEPRVVDGMVLMDLPLHDLEDGGFYTFRLVLLLRDRREVPIPGALEIQLNIGIPLPEVLHTDRVTLDPQPELQWMPSDWDARVATDAGIVWAVPRDLDAAGDESLHATGDEPRGGSEVASSRPPEPLVSPEQITAGTRRTWRVRFRSSHGVLGPWSSVATIRYDLHQSVPVPAGTAPGDRSVVSRPGLIWDPVDGATGYEVEFWFNPDGAGEGTVYRSETVHSFVRLPAELQGNPELLASQRIFWRVRARGHHGVATPFTPAGETHVDVLISALAPVLPEGVTAEVQRGTPPGVPVVVDRPFGMARHLLTNRAAAELFNQGLRHGEIVLPQDPPNVLEHEATGFPLLALGHMDFGVQHALQWDGEVRVRDGYAGHPVVGVTWYGAVWLMNRLSLLEARQPVYRWINRDDGNPGVAISIEHDGYRLPTETEWALAVAQQSLPQAGDAVSLSEHRAITPGEMRGINFLRSGDPWEDPLPPHTRAGGPTNPVGALGTASPAGLHDLLGNVWEWTGDWFDRQWADHLTTPNPMGPAEGVPDPYGQFLRVVRGGAWNTPADRITTTARGGFPPAAASHSIGVRAARTLAAPPPMR